MCIECKVEPCNPRCPNAEEKIICAICEDCLWDMNGLDLAERLGITEIM